MPEQTVDSAAKMQQNKLASAQQLLAAVAPWLMQCMALTHLFALTTDWLWSRVVAGSCDHCTAGALVSRVAFPEDSFRRALELRVQLPVWR